MFHSNCFITRFYRFFVRPLKISVYFLIGFPILSFSKTNDAEQYDRMATSLLKDVYPLLAKQIIDDYKIKNGLALDIGCGGGYLSLELARISNLKIYGIDIDPNAITIAKRNLAESDLEHQVVFLEGNVQDMIFRDNLFDLVISRGSFRFWPDKVKAFKEICRVLRPSGVAFIGGGLGRYLSRAETERIWQEMKNWRQQTGKQAEWEKTKVSSEQMREILKIAGIKRYKLIEDEGCDCRMWVEIRK